MLLQALTLIHHITTMLFGIFLSAFFLGAKQDKKNILLLLSTGAVLSLIHISTDSLQTAESIGRR